MVMANRAAAILGFAWVCFWLCGCGSDTSSVKEVKGVKVNGVLMQNGKLLKFKENETITVSFSMGEGAEQIATSAEVSKTDGTFTLEGPTQQGIPAGTYRVQVAGDIYGGGGEEVNRFRLMFEDDNDSTTPLPRPLKVEVSSEEGQTIVVDLGKWTAKKK